MNESIYVLSVPYTYDNEVGVVCSNVAICYANTKKTAIKTFAKMYDYTDIQFDMFVKKAEMNKLGIALLTR